MVELTSTNDVEVLRRDLCGLIAQYLEETNLGASLLKVEEVASNFVLKGRDGLVLKSEKKLENTSEAKII